ncbi:MAG: GTPase Era [Candidatus Magasanikbacteria bacterium GW2011_GWA2_56_11]|uniref:GTPase Era n=1 Tax=Candidatus Magasanikbacteria bacterium GW2011_GWA2_56_11 TaxID=1619044 RepID=A0A0G2AKG9_9BACT|nr:MAG: GTPase Era [Candidatus Magasanikbacteria bacterium GW2011_GWA2_56_11]
MTRDIIHGVINTPEGQAVIIDTPGIFKDRKSSLTAKLINKAKEAIAGVDVIIYVVDPTREIGAEERYTYGLIRHLGVPKILVINKSDLPKNERPFQADYEAWSDNFDAVFSLSALRASHIKPLIDKLISLMAEGEPLYPPEQLTNVNNYFWVAEIIREKVFSVFDKEVPYSMTVETDNIEDKSDVIVISARILTDEARYKKIIIGARGAKIKEIGQLARRELEQALNKKVYLELEVEVDKHWVERME